TSKRGKTLMTSHDRRGFLKSGTTILAAGLGGSFDSSVAMAQNNVEIKLKLGNDLPATHSVNVRLREAIDAIGADTRGTGALHLFPNNELGSDCDMMSELRSGALELATMPGTVLSTLIPTASLTGVGFAFTSYDKVWAAMDGDVGAFIRRNI